MTPTDTELERLAKAATPGPWDFRAWSDYLYITKYLTDPPDISQSVNIARGIKQNNAAFIAAFNPAVALDLLTRLRAAERERDRLLESLTPSTETKAAYIGEFTFEIEDATFDGNYAPRPIQVPWTTIKEIMAAIKARALKKAPSHDQP